MITKECMGNCPVCDSDNIRYGEHEFDSNLVTLDFLCMDCGAVGEEVYCLDYCHTAIRREARWVHA